MLTYNCDINKKYLCSATATATTTAFRQIVGANNGLTARALKLFQLGKKIPTACFVIFNKKKLSSVEKFNHLPPDQTYITNRFLDSAFAETAPSDQEFFERKLLLCRNF